MWYDAICFPVDLLDLFVNFESFIVLSLLMLCPTNVDEETCIGAVMCFIKSL